MTLEDDGIRIQQQIEDAEFIDGERRSIIRVTFMVGRDGPFIERFPKAEFSSATRDARLRDFARQVRR